MKSWKTPTSQTVEKALAAVKKETDRQYFFSRLKNPHWLQPLAERGYFQDPPKPIPLPDGIVKFPFWPELTFLSNIVTEAPDQIIGLLLELPKTENPRIYATLVEIALTLKGEKSAQLLPKVLEYLETDHQVFSHRLPDLLAHWNAESQFTAALTLTRKAIPFSPDPKAKEKEKRRKENPADFFTRLEPTPRLDLWEFNQILDRGVLPIAQHQPLEVASILIEAVADMIQLRMHRDELEKGSEEDISELWCRRLDRSEQDIEGPKAALVHTLAEACKAVYAMAPDSIHSIDRVLRDQRWNVFKRIRQYLYALNSTEQTLPWIREFLLTHADYGAWDHHFEFQLMARRSCEHFGSRLLTETERSTIFEAVLSGPSQESFREWMAERYTDEDWTKRKRYFHRKQFRPFASLLFGNYRTYFDELSAELSKEELTDESYSQMGEIRSGSVSYRSPKSPEELKRLGDEELLACINEWEKPHRDSTDWLVEINISALAGTFQNVFKDEIVPDAARLAFWFENRERIQRPTYARAMVQAMQAITKEQQFDQLGRWLGFCDWILERPIEAAQKDERSHDESRENPNWQSCRRAVGDLVGMCLEKDVHVPLTARDALGVLLRKLCTQFDYRLDRDRRVLVNREDQVTEAINNTRGRALENLVNFGYWARRHEQSVDLPELRKILESRFANQNAHPLTLPEHALLGLHFVRIWSLNNEWAEANKSHFFPQDKLPIWREAFSAFIRFNHSFLRTFKVLRDDFVFALNHLDALGDTGERGRDATDILSQHLFTYYLWDAYPLRGNDSLLNDFYEKTAGDQPRWGRLFDHIGRTLRNTTQLENRTHERIIAFFDWRFEQAKPAELQNFTFWLKAACLGPDWRLDAYAKILDITHTKDVGLSIELDSLNEMLESHTSKVVACFAKITDSFARDATIYIQTEGAKSILLAGFKSTDGAVHANAERARENLLKAGRFDFMDIW